MFDIPILFLVFNRPKPTQQVFDRIRAIKPQKLYLAADGYRQDKKGEKELCEEVKSIINKIDWNCEVKTLYREGNLGCGKAVSEAITWFFNQVEMGIILEDDCLPDMSFFTFCKTLLEFYKNDEEVMHISGDNFQIGKIIGDGSYYFSKLPHNWGWASWKRTWEKYDINLTDLDEYLKSNPTLEPYWKNVFYLVKDKKIDTWDYQYNYLLLKYNGKSILPNTNLVRNIGFNEEATHTKNSLIYYNYQDFGSIEKIIHPSNKSINVEADRFTYETYFVQSDKRKAMIRCAIKKLRNWFEI